MNRGLQACTESTWPTEQYPQMCFSFNHMTWSPGIWMEILFLAIHQVKNKFSLSPLLIQTPPTPGSCYQSKSGRQRSLQAAKASPLTALLQTTKLLLKQSRFPGLYEVQWTKPQKRKHGSVFTENKKVYLLLFYVHDCFPSRMSMCCMSTVPGGARRRHKMPPEWEL